MNVFSYIRVSSKGQVDGDGPERQRQAIAAFSAAHRLNSLGEFFEKGVSGEIDAMDRPEFSDMLERITNLAVNGIVVAAIVVERIDRLARDLMVSELLLAECRKRNIRVFAADQGALIDVASDGGDPTRVLIRQIMGALAQWEKSTLVRKLRISRERIRLRTGRCEGAKPYGTFPGEQEVLDYLRVIICESPRPTYAQIAGLMNAAGLKTRRGTKWTRGHVWAFVKSHVEIFDLP